MFNDVRWHFQVAKTTRDQWTTVSILIPKQLIQTTIDTLSRQFSTQRTQQGSVVQLCTRGLFTSMDSSACFWKAFAIGESSPSFNRNMFSGQLSKCSLCFRERRKCTSLRWYSGWQAVKSVAKVGSGNCQSEPALIFTKLHTVHFSKQLAITVYCNQFREMGTWFIWHFYGKTTLNML